LINVSIRPYTSTPAKLLIGHMKTPYYVTSSLLKNASNSHTLDFVFDRKHKAQVLSLPNIEEDTAHTLVHHLYTGAYQTLDNYISIKNTFVDGGKKGGNGHAIKRSQFELKKTMRVMVCAHAYGIATLLKSAKEQFQRCVQQLNIVDALTAVSDVWETLTLSCCSPVGDSDKCKEFSHIQDWVLRVLKESARREFDIDYKVPENKTLQDELFKSELGRIVMIWFVQFYSSLVQKLMDENKMITNLGLNGARNNLNFHKNIAEDAENDGEKFVAAVATEESNISPTDPLLSEAKLEEEPATGLVAQVDEDRVECTKMESYTKPEYLETEHVPVEEFTADTAEPVMVDTAPIVDSKFDGWVSCVSTKKPKKKGNRLKEQTTQSAVVIQVDTNLASQTEKENSTNTAINNNDDPWGNWLSSSKTEKKGKKGKKNITRDCEPEAATQVENPWSDWGNWVKSTKKDEGSALHALSPSSPFERIQKQSEQNEQDHTLDISDHQQPISKEESGLSISTKVFMSAEDQHLALPSILKEQPPETESVPKPQASFGKGDLPANQPSSVPDFDDSWGLGVSKEKKKQLVNANQNPSLSNSDFSEESTTPLAVQAVTDDPWGFGLSKIREHISVISSVERPPEQSLEPADKISTIPPSVVPAVSTHGKQGSWDWGSWQLGSSNNAEKDTEKKSDMNSQLSFGFSVEQTQLPEFAENKAITTTHVSDADKANRQLN
jgi:hypothetical protein